MPSQICSHRSMAPGRPNAQNYRKSCACKHRCVNHVLPYGHSDSGRLRATTPQLPVAGDMRCAKVNIETTNSDNMLGPATMTEF